MRRLAAPFLAALALAACASSPGSAPAAPWPHGCAAQAPAGYRLAQAAASGTLEVRVQGPDAAGKEASAQFTGSTGVKCPTKAVTATVGADGVARLERLRPGPYTVGVPGGASKAATVEVGKTVVVSL